jgi:hypothetical protein
LFCAAEAATLVICAPTKAGFRTTAPPTMDVALACMSGTPSSLSRSNSPSTSAEKDRSADLGVGQGEDGVALGGLGDVELDVDTVRPWSARGRADLHVERLVVVAVVEDARRLGSSGTVTVSVVELVQQRGLEGVGVERRLGDDAEREQGPGEGAALLVDREACGRGLESDDGLTHGGLLACAGLEIGRPGDGGSRDVADGAGVDSGRRGLAAGLEARLARASSGVRTLAAMRTESAWAAARSSSRR